MQEDVDLRLLPVEAVLLVADVLDRHARDMGDPVLGDVARAARLAGDHDAIGGGERLAGGADFPGVEAGGGAFAEEEVDDLVGNAVADLVGMALGDGLAGELVILTRHSLVSPMLAPDLAAVTQKWRRF